MDHPREGQVINVLCYPKSQKVKLIAQDWTYYPAEDERFDAAEHGSPGSLLRRWHKAQPLMS